MSKSSLKTSIFIDASNIYLAGIGYHSINVKPEKLINILSQNRNVVDSYFFSAEDSSNSHQVSFHKMLKNKYGITVFTEPLINRYITLRCKSCNNIMVPKKCDKCSTLFQLKPHISKRIDVLLTVKILEFSDDCDEIIFATGDSDFIPLIRDLRNDKKKIVCIASFNDSLSDDYKKNDPLTNKKIVDDIIILDKFISKLT